VAAASRVERDYWIGGGAYHGSGYSYTEKYTTICSHATLEHSSIVKFIEWNWLGTQVGQLGARDATTNNLGSLLDPTATGAAIPE
jgi:hypothetical protein